MNRIQKRCNWCLQDSLYVNYHDTEWGVPVYNDQLLFELLILEGMQAGLSWLIILKKRNSFRAAFDNFNVNKIVKYNESKINNLLTNTNIIRHQLKIQAVVNNAKAFLEIKKEWKSFSDYIWHFVDGHCIKNHWKKETQVPVKSDISENMSKDLKKYGFKFVGNTICYAFMQAAGMVNDHIIDCFRYTLK